MRKHIGDDLLLNGESVGIVIHHVIIVDIPRNIVD